MIKTPEQIERAYAVLDHIEKNADLHDQGSWASGPLAQDVGGFTAEDVMPGCGTTACFAGWTALLDGKRMVGNLIPELSYEHVSDWAEDRLGLSGPESNRLLYAARTLAEVRDAVTEIFGPRPPSTL